MPIKRNYKICGEYIGLSNEILPWKKTAMMMTEELRNPPLIQMISRPISQKSPNLTRIRFTALLQATSRPIGLPQS